MEVKSMPPTVDLFPNTKPDELVTPVHGQPMTTTRRVAAMFGKEHKNVLRAVERLRPDLPGDFSRLNFEPRTYVDDRGKEQPEYLLTQDGFLMLAMGFTGPAAIHWRAAFINAFNAMTKTLKRQQRALLSAERVLARAALAKQHSSVMSVLKRTRSKRGKTTEAHHYANEARLIGYAMTGTYAGLDHDTLDEDQLSLLQRVETEDIALLVEGANYEARKAALCEFVRKETGRGALASGVDDLSQLTFEPSSPGTGMGGPH